MCGVGKVEKHTAQQMANDEEVKALPEHGEIGNGRRVDNIKSTSGGTHAEYLIRRLKRDAAAAGAARTRACHLTKM